MRLIASAAPSTRFATFRDRLPTSTRTPRLPAHPRAAGGRAARPDLRRLIQLLVGGRLSAAQLAPKADRALSAGSVYSEMVGEVADQAARIVAMKFATSLRSFSASRASPSEAPSTWDA